MRATLERHHLPSNAGSALADPQSGWTSRADPTQRTRAAEPRFAAIPRKTSADRGFHSSHVDRVKSHDLGSGCPHGGVFSTVSDTWVSADSPRGRLTRPPDQRLARPLEPVPVDVLGQRSRRSLRSSTGQAGQAGEHGMSLFEAHVRNLAAVASVPPGEDDSGNSGRRPCLVSANAERRAATAPPGARDPVVPQVAQLETPDGRRSCANSPPSAANAKRQTRDLRGQAFPGENGRPAPVSGP
jgi:hypothetical protein